MPFGEMVRIRAPPSSARLRPIHDDSVRRPSSGIPLPGVPHGLPRMVAELPERDAGRRRGVRPVRIPHRGAGLGAVQRLAGEAGHGGQQRFDRDLGLGHGEPGEGDALPAGAVQDPMRRGPDPAAAPQLQHVAGVDQKAVLGAGRVEPFAVARQHLQAAHRIVGKEGQHVEILVRMDAQRSFPVSG